MIFTLIAIFCGIAFNAFSQAKNMEFLHSHIYIQSEFAGTKLNLAFDTGSPYTCLDSITLASGNIEYKAKTRALAGGAGNNRVFIPILLDQMTYTFAGNSHTNKMTPIFELKPILGDYCDGLIGIDVISEKVLAIDYMNEKISVSDNLPADIDSYSSIDVEIKNQRIYMPVSITVNSSIKIEGKALLDLGSGGGVTLTSATAKQYNLDTITPCRRYKMLNGGIGGSSTGTYIKTEKVSLAGITTCNTSVDFSTNESGALSNKEYIAIVGNDITSLFHMVLDWNAKKLYLKANGVTEKESKLSELGFGYTDRSKTFGYWIVNCLYENSTAEQRGLSLGDKITHINGRNVTSISIQEQQNFFNEMDKCDITIERENLSTTTISF